MVLLAECGSGSMVAATRWPVHKNRFEAVPADRMAGESIDSGGKLLDASGPGFESWWYHE